MSTNHDNSKFTSFDVYKKASEQQLATTGEPQNGGGSMVDFYEALGGVGNKITDVPIVVSFPGRVSK